MSTGDRPNRDLGPYFVGDSVPDWVFTITGLEDSSVFTDADLALDLPDGTDYTLGTDSFVLTVVSATVLEVAYTADPTKTFTVAGMYRGQLALLISARRYTVQQFMFEVKTGAHAT